MSTEPSMALRQLKETLLLGDDELDEDLSIALASLVTTAVHDKEPKHDLRNIIDAIQRIGCASEIEPLTVLPIIVESGDACADELLDTMSKECSAKEVVMAAEEVMESLERRLQVDDEDDEENVSRVLPARVIARLIHTYAIVIPRLPKWKKSPSEVVESRLAELEAVMTLVGYCTSADESRVLIACVAQFALALKDGADDRTKTLLRHLIEETLSTFPNTVNGNLAQKAFGAHFRRLVVPQESSKPEAAGTDFPSTWSAYEGLGGTTSFLEQRPSLASFILLSHSPSYTFSVATLTAFFPIVLSCIQSNVALDEVLGVLLSTLAPMHATSPRPELSTDLIMPLVHLLPHLASNHSEPDVRHYTFRIIGLVLGLSPPSLRFRLLQELLGDEDIPPQMRVAAVGLLKEAVLQGLSTQDKSIFASPLLISTFGPLVFRPSPSQSFDTLALEDFLNSPEPLRLVECLGLYYVLLLRDTKNTTGVRDSDALGNVQRALLRPLGERLRVWQQEMAENVEDEAHDHDAAMQLGILDMWLERVQSAIADVSSRK